MSVSYTSTSFGAPQTGSGTARHEQRHSSSSSHSSATFAPPAPASAQALPLPATAAHSRTRPSYDEEAMWMQYEAIGHFFGCGRRPELRQTRDRAERNSNPRSGRGHTGSTSATTLPPSYDAHTEVESLPTYKKVEEYDAKWNRKLFWYGFFFFPLWILGIVSPFVKPNHDPARDNRTKEDQEEDFANMRKVEIRWAWRCAIALLGLATLVTVAVVVGVTASANKN